MCPHITRQLGVGVFPCHFYLSRRDWSCGSGIISGLWSKVSGYYEGALSLRNNGLEQGSIRIECGEKKNGSASRRLEVSELLMRKKVAPLNCWCRKVPCGRAAASQGTAPDWERLAFLAYIWPHVSFFLVFYWMKILESETLHQHSVSQRLSHAQCVQLACSECSLTQFLSLLQPHTQSLVCWSIRQWLHLQYPGFPGQPALLSTKLKSRESTSIALRSRICRYTEDSGQHLVAIPTASWHRSLLRHCLLVSLVIFTGIQLDPGLLEFV